VRSLPGRLVLLGHPVGHSFSPAMMNAALAAAGIEMKYEAVDVEPSSLASEIASLRRDGAAGNVTIPHKERFAAHCDRLTGEAARTAAVNAFSVESGDLIGHNTDVEGFDRALRAVLLESGREMPRVIAVVGAGGAASAVLAAISGWPKAPRSIRIVSRTPSRVDRLIGRYPALAVAHSEKEIPGDTELLVNATPVGLLDDDLPVPIAALPPDCVVYDLVYRPDETRLVREARTTGHIAADGLRMLLEQGASAFRGWFGIEPDRERMWAALTSAISRGCAGR
jgi:shikimate dehydrogenase